MCMAHLSFALARAPDDGQFSIPVMIRLERFFRFDADMVGLVRTRSGELHADLSYAPLLPAGSSAPWRPPEC
jgi:hypothetical protein